MFRKIISGLPYSPALVGQLGFYARRLRQEEATRRMGLVFTALALVMQSFTVFSPPEPANASNASDMIHGGIRSKQDILAVYDQSARGSGDFKDIMDYAGITRQELTELRDGSVNSKQFGTGEGAVLTWGRQHRFSSAQGEVKHVIPRSNGGSSTVYSKPLWRYDSLPYTKANGSTYDAFVGHSKAIGWFAIAKDCGNLLTKKTPRPHPNGKVLVANCQRVTGYAYDARQMDEKVRVFLYFGGPPGKGEKVGPVIANNKTPESPKGNGHGFSVNVPEKYKKSGKETKVYGVMVPLAGWNESSVQIGSATIPGNCVEPKKPAASCIELKSRLISRTQINLVARADTEDGAKVNAYVFTVKDKTGKVVASKTVQSGELKAESGVIDLKTAGDYTADVIVKTSLGDKSSGDCAKPVRIAAADKCPYNPDLGKNHPDCKPCPGKPEIWVKDAECAPNLVQGKEVKNLTQNIDDADGTTVKSGDRIEYTVYVENNGAVATKTDMKEDLGDVLEYASITDNGGGSFDENSKVLAWNDVEVKANEKQIRKFVVQVNASIPATPQGTSEPGSYDCVMNNVFGNSVSMNVDCPIVKGVESTVSELPKTGPTANAIFSAIVLSVVTYFYMRTRMLRREVRLVRNDFNMGTIG